VDPLFASASSLELWSAWTAALGFAVQLYVDFSAFCEIALGVSMLFGIAIPLNFFSPYRSTNITDFWRSWHMTLGRFFRDFVYIPLGGNRHGLVQSVAALSIAMFLAGLWHGAATTFVLWGLLHAALLAAHKLWRRSHFTVPRFPAQGLTLTCVIAGWVLFRATSVSDALAIWGAMIGTHGVLAPSAIASALPWLPAASESRMTGAELPLLIVMLVALARMRNIHEWRLSPTTRWAAFVGVSSLAAAFSFGNATPYLYFQF
jgi:D-alanyl-lipoteichoic acid acyltransferase DltB (MBOAT superfamily)